MKVEENGKYIPDKYKQKADVTMQYKIRVQYKKTLIEINIFHIFKNNSSSSKNNDVPYIK